MRLTLRTLLAWLDDTLPASEVKQIGKQVGESPFAQELVDRTYRVTRQRRLLVPSSTGPDAIDPNTVAAYLDNELPADDVAEYEKRCLKSDVTLAEAASIHQILSLIGQKAKVPPEARHRMYRLVKGREAAGRRHSAPAPAATREPVTPPLTTWSPPSSAGRPVAERLGIAALVLGLLVVVVWTAATTFTQEQPSIPERRPEAVDKSAEVAIATPPPRPEPAPPPETKPADTSKTAQSIAEAEKAANEAASHGIKALGDAPVFAWDRDKSDWVRTPDGAALKDNSRIMILSPFWSGFQAGPAQVQVIGSTEATLTAAGRSAAIGLALAYGRVILRGAPEGKPYRLDLAGHTVTVSPSPGTTVGLERYWKPATGASAPESPLTLFVADGEATIQSGEQKEVVTGPGSITVAESGKLAASQAAPPAWLSASGPSPSEKQLGDRFLKSFSPGGSVLRDLVQAVDGDDPDVRRLAIFGLGEVGDAEMIVPVLNNSMTDPGTRRAAAEVLGAMLIRGGDAAKAVRSELEKVYGIEYQDDVAKLLVGFTPEEARREATFVELVKLLTAPELGARELALRSLMALTGRDNLEYEPTRPEGKGLKAWQDLLHRKELVRPAPAPAAAAPGAK